MVDLNAITVDDVMACWPCKCGYPRKRVIELAAGRAAMSLPEIMVVGIPAEDRVWLACHLLPHHSLVQLAERWVERAIRRVYPDASRKWNRWADRWLSGEDRTEDAAAAVESARVAAAERHAVARAAVQSARVARGKWAAASGPAEWAVEAAEWGGTLAAAAEREQQIVDIINAVTAQENS